MNKFKTVVFGYNFFHWKTQATLINMFLYGFKPDAVILADWEKLDIPKSILSTTPRTRLLHTPEALCKSLGIPLRTICGHNSEECVNFLGKHKFEVGVVAGARILKEQVIDELKHGIINIHPGKLPECRGLDTLKWSIHDDIELEVTAHFIDKYVDCGLMINSRIVSIFTDDTLRDLGLRIQHEEQELLIDTLNVFRTYGIKRGAFKLIGEGTRYPSMPQEVEMELSSKLIEYRRKRAVVSCGF